MQKLHKKGLFGVGWVAADVVTEHWGKKPKGKSTEHPCDPNLTAEENIDRVLAEATQTLLKLVTMLVEYKVSGMGTPEDVDKRYEVQEIMNEALGWAIATEAVLAWALWRFAALCCGQRVAQDALANTEHFDYTRIYERRRRLNPLY